MMYWNLTNNVKRPYKEEKYFFLLFSWVWLKLLPVFRSKRGLEIYSGLLNILYLLLINYSLGSEGELQMEANVLKSCCSCHW